MKKIFLICTTVFLIHSISAQSADSSGKLIFIGVNCGVSLPSGSFASGMYDHSYNSGYANTGGAIALNAGMQFNKPRSFGGFGIGAEILCMVSSNGFDAAEYEYRNNYSYRTGGTSEYSNASGGSIFTTTAFAGPFIMIKNTGLRFHFLLGTSNSNVDRLTYTKTSHTTNLSDNIIRNPMSTGWGFATLTGISWIAVPFDESKNVKLSMSADYISTALNFPLPTFYSTSGATYTANPTFVSKGFAAWVLSVGIIYAFD